MYCKSQLSSLKAQFAIKCLTSGNTILRMCSKYTPSCFSSFMTLSPVVDFSCWTQSEFQWISQETTPEHEMSNSPSQLCLFVEFGRYNPTTLNEGYIFAQGINNLDWNSTALCFVCQIFFLFNYFLCVLLLKKYIEHLLIHQVILVNFYPLLHRKNWKSRFFCIFIKR